MVTVLDRELNQYAYGGKKILLLLAAERSQSKKISTRTVKAAPAESNRSRRARSKYWVRPANQGAEEQMNCTWTRGNEADIPSARRPVAGRTATGSKYSTTAAGVRFSLATQPNCLRACPCGCKQPRSASAAFETRSARPAPRQRAGLDILRVACRRFLKKRGRVSCVATTSVVSCRPGNKIAAHAGSIPQGPPSRSRSPC